MKSAQRCLYNPGKGRCTQYMCINDTFVLGNRISAIFFFEYRKYCLRIFPKQHALVHQENWFLTSWVVTIIKSDNIELFSNSACHFANVCNLLSCYHNGRILISRYQGVMLRKNDMLFWKFFLNLSAIIWARLWLLA